MITRIKTCFISTTVDARTETLREVLAEKGVTVLDPYDVPVGTDIASTIAQMIERADLVIGVMTRQRRSDWVLLELGQALALKRQIILFAPPKSDPAPFDLHNFLTVRVSLRNREAISFALDQILTSPPPKPPKATPPSQEWRTLGPRADTYLANLGVALAGNHFRGIEELTADILRTSGVDVIAQGAVDDRGVDLAIWDDNLQSLGGNPLLVEIKARIPDVAMLRHASVQLSTATKAAGSVWGLLLYGETKIESLKLPSFTSPNVLVMSLSELIEAMRHRPFPEIVRDLRNRRVHGVKS